MKDQWIDWLQYKRRHFFYGVICIVASLFIAFQVFGKLHKQSPHHFLSANKAFNEWTKNAQDFEKLEQTVQSHSELETKFGALIADKLIVRNEGEKAEGFADSVFKRVMKHTPAHTAFAEGSVLIAKGDMEKALIQAVNLKERLEKDSLLYGFNLIRIASLSRFLEASDQELSAIIELEKFINDGSEASSTLAECFREGDVTLLDYISERKK